MHVMFHRVDDTLIIIVRYERKGVAGATQRVYSTISMRSTAVEYIVRITNKT